MKPMIAMAALAVALVLSPVLSLAEGGDGWKLKQRSDDPRAGYALYVRPHPGSSYAEYRMEIALDGSPKDVSAALQHNMLDPDTYPENLERTLLRREDGVVVTYDYISVPFASDRDVTLRTEISDDPDTGIHRIRWSATQSEGPPPRDGVVRMPSHSGSWTLTPHGNGRTLAVYQGHVELGGRLPASFVDAKMPESIVEQAGELRRTIHQRRVAQR
jgi:hypothetical protein